MREKTGAEPSPETGDPESTTPRYWAFVSYAREDEEIAAWLHRRLERYRLPRSLRGRETDRGEVPARLAPAFLDTAEATPSPDLGETIEDALRASRTLVVVCSPAAVRSEWVDREISTFQALGRGDRIFCVLAGGEPGAAERGEPEREPFPVSIRDRAVGEEPLAADLRKGRSRRVEFVRLVAGLVGVRFDELFRRERRRRLRRAVGAGVGALTAVTLAVALVLRVGAAFMAQAAPEAEDTRRGLELARRAVAWWEMPETEEALRTMLNRHRERIRVQFPSGLTAGEVGPDGRRVAVIDAEGRTAFWAPATDPGPVRASGAVPDADHLAFSHDGSRVVGYGPGTDVQVWDAATGASVARIPVGSRVLAAALAPAGELLVTSDEEVGVRLWDVDSGSTVDALPGQAGPVHHVGFSPDGRRMATAGRDGTARVFDLEGGVSVTLAGHADAVSHVAFDPTGTRVVTSSLDRTVRVWDALSGTLVFETLEQHDRPAWSVFSPDGVLVVSVDDVGPADPAEPSVTVREADTGAPVRRFQGHADRIHHVVFSPDGRAMATASRDSVHVWLDPRQVQGTLLDSPRPPEAGVVSIGFLATPGFPLVSVGRDGSVLVLDWRDRRQPTLLPVASQSLAFPPSGDRLLTGGDDGTVRIWNPGRGVPEESWTAHPDAVLTLTVSPDGRRVVTGGRNGSARVWERADCIAGGSGAGSVDDGPCRPRSVLARGGTGLLRVAFGGDGRRLFTADEGGTVVVWDADAGTAVDSVDAGRWIDAFAVAPGTDRLVIASGARALLWTPGSGRPAVELPHDGGVSHAAFSPDGALVVTASDDATARIWDADSGAELRALVHDGPVLHAAWVPTGTAVVTASADGTARVWRLRDGAPEAVLRGHGGAVRWVGVIPGGDRVVTGGDDGTARLWSLDGSGQVVLPGGGGPVLGAAIAPGGGTLATLSADLVVRTYTLPVRHLLRLADSILSTDREVGSGG